MKCETCRFFHCILILDTAGRWKHNGQTLAEYEAAEGDPTGECRRYPPAVAADGKEALFPMVCHDLWCGEYQPEPKRPT